MKKFAWVLIVTLICAMVPWNSVQSMRNPIDYRDINRSNGDDHTWGGENGFVPGGSPVESNGNPAILPFYNGFDYLFWKYFMPFWYGSSQAPIVHNKPVIVIEGTTNTDEKPVEQINIIH